MTERRVRPAALADFIDGALRGVGLPEADARSVALLIAEADARGSDGHGIFRLPQYIRRIKAGGIDLKPNIRVVQERAATGVIDGDNAMGHLVRVARPSSPSPKQKSTAPVGSGHGIPIMPVPPRCTCAWCFRTT